MIIVPDTLNKEEGAPIGLGVPSEWLKWPHSTDNHHPLDIPHSALHLRIVIFTLFTVGFIFIYFNGQAMIYTLIFHDMQFNAPPRLTASNAGMPTISQRSSTIID